LQTLESQKPLRKRMNILRERFAVENNEQWKDNDSVFFSLASMNTLAEIL